MGRAQTMVFEKTPEENVGTCYYRMMGDKLYKEELHISCPPLKTITMMKSKRMRWTRDVAGIGHIINAYILV
jgi:hypothetical protein